MNQISMRLTFMGLFRLALIFSIVAFISQAGKAQVFYDCVDTNRINPYYICGDPTYAPVCGCNGVTYRNGCASYYIGGVNYTTNGTCENFGFDILQNPVLYYLTLSVYTKKSEQVTVQVWNLFGKIEYQYIFNSYETSVQEIIVDTYEWDKGMYIVVINVNGEQQTKKLIKVTSS